jgi:hypothetical protein
MKKTLMREEPPEFSDKDFRPHNNRVRIPSKNWRLWRNGQSMAVMLSGAKHLEF